MTEIDVEEAYQRYFPIVREKCSRMLKDPAEAQDVAQETFTRLWASRSQFKNPSGVASWIYRTSTRLAVDRYRYLSRTNEVAFPVDELLGTEAESPSLLAQSRQQLALLARRVPANELQVAVLCRIDRLNHEEAGRVMQISGRTVRRLLTKFEARIPHLRGEEA